MLTVKEAAHRLGVSLSKMYELKADVGFYRIGGSIRFEPEDVDAFKQRCKVTAPQTVNLLPPRLKHLVVKSR